MRTYFSAYGHTNTALMPRAYGGARWGGDGHVITRFMRGYGRVGFGAHDGYGHVVRTAERVDVDRRFRRDERGGRGFDRARLLRDRFGVQGLHRRFGFGFAGGNIGAYEGYGDARTSGGFVLSSGAGTTGMGGAYSAADTGEDGYASETPLTARFAEVPLGPSPGLEGGPNDRYAEAASGDVGPGPHIITIDRAARPACGCGPRAHAEPIVYRYGVGTAY